jgi:hypothetical protein
MVDTLRESDVVIVVHGRWKVEDSEL